MGSQHLTLWLKYNPAGGESLFVNYIKYILLVTQFSCFFHLVLLGTPCPGRGASIALRDKLAGPTPEVNFLIQDFFLMEFVREKI